MANRPNPKEGNPIPEGTPENAGTADSNMSEALKAACRIASSYPTGARRRDLKLTKEDGYNEPVPGIIVGDYIPTFGHSFDSTSALNRAMIYEFNKIRSKISGTRPYQPSDHMLYRMCVDSLSELYDVVVRIYGMLNIYSPTNIYRPVDIFNALDLDYDDWSSNASALYVWLLNHEKALTPFPRVPLGHITERRRIYNSQIFSDGTIDAAAIIIMNQKVFWSYEKVDQVKGLKPRTMPRTFGEFLKLWDEMYTALANSDDAYIIAADVRRAFEDSVITDLKAPSVEYSVTPVKLDGFLDSFMNINTVGSFQDEYDADDVWRFADYLKLKDKNGFLINAALIPISADTTDDPTGEYSVLWHPVEVNHINSVEAAPNEETVMRCMRFHAQVEEVSLYDSEEEGYHTYTGGAQVYKYGTELVYGLRLIKAPGAEAVCMATAADELIGTGDYVIMQNDDVSPILASISCFDWHPPVYTRRVYDYSNRKPWCCYEDVQNYIPLSREQAAQIFDAYLLSEFGVN